MNRRLLTSYLKRWSVVGRRRDRLLRSSIETLPGQAGMKLGKPKLVKKWKLMHVICSSQNGFTMGKSNLTKVFATVIK